MQLLLLLLAFLVLPELLRGAYLAANFKRVLGITRYSFPRCPQNCLKVTSTHAYLITHFRTLGFSVF